MLVLGLDAKAVWYGYTTYVKAKVCVKTKRAGTLDDSNVVDLGTCTESPICKYSKYLRAVLAAFGGYTPYSQVPMSRKASIVST